MSGCHALRRWLGVLAIIGSAVAADRAVHAATPEAWKESLYSYRSRPASLHEVLSAFARSHGLELRESGVHASHAAQFPEGAARPGAFLDALAGAHRLQWFVYDGRLYVSSQGSSVTERIDTAGLSPGSAKQALAGLGLLDPKFGWGELDLPSPAVLVSGPPAYVSLLRNAVGRVAASAEAAQPQAMVFRLKYASAGDVETSARERTTVIPGVATILQHMLGIANEPWPRAQMPADDFKSPGPIATARQGLIDAAASSGGGFARRSDRRPSVEAYVPLNAIVVRDEPNRRAFYESLLSTLDVPQRQVEILATIADVDADKLQEWSAGLSVAGGRAGARVEPAGSPGSGPTIVLWALNKLSLRLRALESEGNARVLSRPSVLTLDNMGAVLDMSQSAYFRLVGERATDLKSITVGTMLKVTPHILSEGPEPAVRIAVDVEDGAIQDAGNKGDTALARRSVISTQAIVHPGEALVIGGHREQQSETNTGRIPGLASLPVVGRLFRSQSASAASRERLFIVTARVVDRSPVAPVPAQTDAMRRPSDREYP